MSGLTLEMIMRAKRVLDAAEVPHEQRFFYVSLQQLRRHGLTPLQIQTLLQTLLKYGTLVRASKLP